MEGTSNMQKRGMMLNKDELHFRCTSVPLFGKIISRQGIRPNLRKLKGLSDMPLSRLKSNCRHSSVY